MKPSTTNMPETSSTNQAEPKQRKDNEDRHRSDHELEEEASRNGGQMQCQYTQQPGRKPKEAEKRQRQR